MNLFCRPALKFALIAIGLIAFSAPAYAATAPANPQYTKCEGERSDPSHTGIGSGFMWNDAACEHACENIKKNSDACTLISAGGGQKTKCAQDCQDTYPKSTKKEESCKKCCQTGCGYPK